jgi:hypothetical protein
MLNRPRWRVPEPYGYPEAIHSQGSVAAPLLAGFSLTLVVYTLTATEAFRWPNAALALMLAAAFSLLLSVQCAVVARSFTVTPGELEAWWPDAGEPERRRLNRREQFRHAAAHLLWARRSERLYLAGILLLFGGITIALVPPQPLAEIPPARLLALGVGVAGLAVAAAWMAAPRLPTSWIEERMLREPPGEEPWPEEPERESV